MTDPRTPEGRAELRRLHAECVAAAEGTWVVYGGGDYSVVKSMWNDGPCGDCDITGAINEPDAELIVAAVTALPALLDALDEAEAAIDSIREYAQLLRAMADEVRQLDAVYQARVYDDIATTLERKIGDRP